MNTEIDFGVQTDETNIVPEIIMSSKSFFEVFTKKLIETDAVQQDQEFDMIMDQTSKAKLLTYLQSGNIKEQILEKMINDPILKQYEECIDILEQIQNHPVKMNAKKEKRKNFQDKYELFLSNLKAKCKNGGSMTLKQDYITLMNEASKCFKPKTYKQCESWGLKLPRYSQFICAYCEKQFSNPSRLRAHEQTKHSLEEKELAKIEDQEEEEDT